MYGKMIVRIVLSMSTVVLVLATFMGSIYAQIEEDCPNDNSNPGNWPMVNTVYAYSTINGNEKTYMIDTVNKHGTSIKELCVYPTPGFTGSNNDLTIIYSGWQVDYLPSTPKYFGFLARGPIPQIPLNGNTGIQVGRARYSSFPSGEILGIHLTDSQECGSGSGGTCWRRTSLSPLTGPIPPIANSGGPYTGIEGTVVTFDGSASSDADDSIIYYSWNFGDGNTGTGINPSHMYAQNGIYTATLNVTDNSGLASENTTMVTISDTDPVASFTGIPLNGPAPLTVTFNDSSTSYDGVTSWKWNFEWDFGRDGIIDSTVQNPVHTYTFAGTYTAKLTVCENDGDCSNSTVVVTVTTGSGSGDTQPPTEPLCPVAIATGPTTIYLNWWASADNVGVAGYKIYRSTDNTSFYYLTTTTGISYTDTGLTTGVTYYYAIEAFDMAGNPSMSSDIVHAIPRDIESPIVTVPANSIAEATSSSGATVSFLASAIDDIDGHITPICDPSSGSIFHIGLTTVTCRAADDAGNIGSAIFTITVVDTTPPTPPSMTATAISTSRIDLSWTASYDAVGVTQYWIYRSTDNFNFIAIGYTHGTTFQNTGLIENKTYYYYVVAFDNAGNPSNPGNIASAKTFAPPPPGTPTPTATGTPSTGTPVPTDTVPPGIVDTLPTLYTPSYIIVEATAPSGAMVTYFVSAYDTEDGDLTNSIICSPLSGSIFPLGMNTVMCWVEDSGGNNVSSVFSIIVRDTISPTSPIGLSATVVSTNRIDLSWIASYDIVGVTQYRIYRSLNNVNFVPIGSTSGTTFSNTGLIPNTTYYYYVAAFDNAGNPSNPSGITSATTLQQPPGPPPTPGPTDTGIPGPLPTDTPNPCIPTANTRVGQTVEVAPIPSVGIRFDAVLQCGDTTVVAYYDNQWVPLPNNYKPILFYNIDTTSTHSGSITIRVTYSNIPSNIDENGIRLFHYEAGNWVDVTTALDTTSNVVTGVVSSLSPFGIGGTSSGTGGSGGSGTVMRGSSFDGIGFLILVICLTTISILMLRRKIRK